MILTVTPNPSLDQTMHVEQVVTRAVNRATHITREPSGKGVNVSLALQAAHVATKAVLPIGGAAGRELEDLLRHEGLPIHPIPIHGDVRSNLTLIEADGATTKINERGPLLTEAEIDLLLAVTERESVEGNWVAFCGSLPQGMSPARLADAVERGRAAGRKVAVDMSDDAFAHIINGPGSRLPHLVKPNIDELATVCRTSLRTFGDAIRAAEALRTSGIETVLLSMGADGAALIGPSGVWVGSSPVERVVNTVGAGDAFLAGYLGASESGKPDRDCLKVALSWGAAAVQSAGTVLRHAPGVTSALVFSGDDIDQGRRLREPGIFTGSPGPLDADAMVRVPLR